MNDAYQDSGVTLNVDVQGGVGEINLKVVWGAWKWRVHAAYAVVGSKGRKR